MLLLTAVKYKVQLKEKKLQDNMLGEWQVAFVKCIMKLIISTLLFLLVGLGLKSLEILLAS